MCGHAWQEQRRRADGQIVCGECIREAELVAPHVAARLAPTVVRPRVARPPSKPAATFLERFAAMSDRSGGPNACWTWRGKGVNGGYGRTRFDGRLRYAHRVAFWLEYGSWPEAVCHRCDNPPCVNPRHLRAGTLADNTLEMWAKGRQGVNGKLTDADVIAISTRYNGGRADADALGAEFGVSYRTVYRIAYGPTPKQYLRALQQKAA